MVNISVNHSVYISLAGYLTFLLCVQIEIEIEIVSHRGMITELIFYTLHSQI